MAAYAGSLSGAQPAAPRRSSERRPAPRSPLRAIAGRSVARPGWGRWGSPPASSSVSSAIRLRRSCSCTPAGLRDAMRPRSRRARSGGPACARSRRTPPPPAHATVPPTRAQHTPATCRPEIRPGAPRAAFPRRHHPAPQSRRGGAGLPEGALPACAASLRARRGAASGDPGRAGCRVARVRGGTGTRPRVERRAAPRACPGRRVRRSG